jgi:hypothetical protein
MSLKNCPEISITVMDTDSWINPYQEMEYKNWLEYIRDILFDRDGCRNAEDLGNLIDDVRENTKKALRGEPCPMNKYNKERK